ncbi:hypothetical protein LCGC14_1293050 [marine sediment metagenome]|uniref:Uncharacterized protein n=1 Tax=marine sediment metagenome TaxID=412755 RepID=A0A0F9NUR9_9ZZZZ
MGRLFAEEKLLDAGISKFPERLSSVGAETLEALYGREMATNFQTIASSIRSLKGMDVERIAAGLKAKAPRPTPPEIGPQLPTMGPPPEMIPPPARTKVQQDALQRLEDLEGALRYVGSVGEGGGIGMYRFGGGASLPVRLLAGAPAAFATGGLIELYGGLITWAATNRARTRAFRNAAAEGFRVGGPATLRLISSYLDYQRDMALIEGRRQGGGPPEPGTSVEITPEKLTGAGIGPPPEPPGPLEPLVSFGFLN